MSWAALSMVVLLVALVLLLDVKLTSKFSFRHWHMTLTVLPGPAGTHLMFVVC